MANSRPALWLGGPSASGKSTVAVALAEQLQGEIVSVDSMQVYRGLDIGTAKPTPEDQRRVPHHLIDIVDLGETFSAGAFVVRAEAAREGIGRRHHVPILCGGTGLYFRALLRGVGAGPGPDPALRQALEAIPLPELLEELSRSDPAAYARIDRQNRRRVVRAVEVIRLSGQPFSQQQADWSAPLPSPPAFFALERAPEDLRRRIDERVDRMFRDGLVEETRRLLDHGLRQNPTALQALGYRQVLEHLDGKRNLPDTIALVKQRTWQFARRQRNWFTRQLPAIPIPVEPQEPAPVTAQRIRQQLPAAPLVNA